MIRKRNKLNLAIIGLGYVGLPLALEFAKKRKVIGFDVDSKRIKHLNLGKDKNLEFSKNILLGSKFLKYSSDLEDLKSADCFIITVPTPINKRKKPDLRPLLKATEMIGKIIKPGDLIIYESTVYPGCIEEVCVPILEKFSKLNYNIDFYCGYSPERINPGDKKHTISNIKKITSGSTPEITDLIDKLYQEIISAGTHKTSSIRIAEAAKVIENTQRDLNIAFINELSMIFSKLKIDTKEVLDAAQSKWNFLPFKPGLVGGHCIGVDPYYLTHKSENVGHNPKVILAGRKINDSMGNYVAIQMIKKMEKKKINIKKSKILIMGLTFKENCADIRNSGVKLVIETLRKKNCKLDLYDPWADKEEIKQTYGYYPKTKLNNNFYDGVVIAVAHKKFKNIGIRKIARLCKKNNVIYDLKYLFPKDKVDLRL